MAPTATSASTTAAPVPVGGGRRRAGWLVTLCAALLVALLPAVPSHADVAELHTRDTQQLLDGIEHARLEVALTDGATARGNLLRFRPGAGNLAMRPVAARGTVAGLETLPGMALRERRAGAVAGVNGGYWVKRPSGAPNGLYIEESRVWAGRGASLSGRHTERGVVGIGAAGALIMDRLGFSLTLDLPDMVDRPPMAIDELNRQVRTSSDGTEANGGELLLFDANYGTSFEVPGGSTLLVVDELALGTGERVTGVVRDVRQPVLDTSYAVPEGTSVLLAYGERAPDISDVEVGMGVGVRPELSPHATSPQAWQQAVSAVPGGPLLIRNGERLSVDAWRDERFGDSHLTGRQPRTAIARDSDGRVLLVTVDGRQNGWSSGVTLIELSEVLLDLGAVDALNLDGGGSTTMTVDAEVRNRPSEWGRSVANGLFVYAPLPPPARGTDGACPPDRSWPTFIDTLGTIHEATIGCLAGWGVTSGVSQDVFAPSRSVTREQMATFLARWIDDVAARGEGRALPEVDGHPFVDVAEFNPHADNIARLADVGVLGGRTADTFAPSRPVTRSQTASLLRAAVEYTTGSAIAAGRDTFTDDAGNVHEPAINALARLGIITGVGGFGYAPADEVKRGSMAALVMRSSDHLVELGTVTPPG